MAEMKCKNPCKKMTITLSPIGEENGFNVGDSSVTLRFDKLVKIERKMVVYTWFNFIIDVGSSLGLWLGLSAIGITDLGINSVVLVKKWLS